MHKLCEKMRMELEALEHKVEKTGKLSCQEVSYVKTLASAWKDLEEIKEEYYPEEVENKSERHKEYDVYNEWISKMTNEDGTRGAYWSKMETSEVARNNGVTFDTIDEDDWYITMNMIYSDYSHIAKRYGVDSISFYVDLAKQWLWDRDTKNGKCKLMAYYFNVVKGK